MGQCQTVGSGARRSSSVLHQQRRHIFRIENVFPCPQDGLRRRKNLLDSPNGDPTQHAVRVCICALLHGCMTMRKEAREGVAEWRRGEGEADGGNGKDGVAEGLFRGTRTQLGSIAYTVRPSADCRSQDTPETRPASQRFPAFAASFLASQLGSGQDSVNYCRLRPYWPCWPQMPCDRVTHDAPISGASGARDG